MTTRRTFLQATAATGVSLGLGGAVAAMPRQDSGPSAGQKLRILMLGGTSFVGRHTVELAIARGHEVTLFNRGRTNADLFPELEKRRGDRDPRKGNGLKALEAGEWDAVVDTSGYYPRLVGASATLLSERVGQYVFISSISVYDDFSVPGRDETAAIGTIPDPTVETMGASFENYGPLKALCEQAAEAAFPGRTTTIRPGLIVGPYDNGPRFTYWPLRVERGGEVMAPGSPDDPVQYIDGRDLAMFILHCIENRITGIYNATGPVHPTNIAELIYGCKAVTGGDAHFTWVNADFLAEHNVGGWMDMPVWMPPRGEYTGFGQTDCSKAAAAGMTTRPLADTVRATLDWAHSFPADKPLRTSGIKPEREVEVLAAWHEHVAAGGD